MPGNTYRLGSVERVSMTEQVLRELRDALVDGRIAQGVPLRESRSRRTLGPGRGAVRETIHQLVHEGLVEYEPHRGAFVRVLSLADRLDVYVAREAIETGAPRRILESEAPGDFSPGRAALKELKKAARGRDRVTDAVIVADIRFHQEVVRLARSPRPSRAHDTLAAETRMLLRYQPAYPGTAYVRDHERLLEALKRRDSRVPDLFAEHLRLSARLICDELSCETREGTRASREEERAMAEEERRNMNSDDLV